MCTSTFFFIFLAISILIRYNENLLLLWFCLQLKEFIGVESRDQKSSIMLCVLGIQESLSLETSLQERLGFVEVPIEKSEGYFQFKQDVIFAQECGQYNHICVENGHFL